ncbi:MAG: adenylosuccinate lyase [Verrucomicrobiaceae bacterium]|jgi:adenylosuccinate lyase|nr:adenylosuccinate lyase [Verrucomicrobiaceae bacterium]
MIPNVLADRYASPAMREIWSAEGRIVLEREFWIAVMKAQRELGLPIPEEAIADYEKVREEVNLDSIQERERISRHDVKARLEEFNDLAGHQEIHKGMTSRDLTENVEQLQVFSSLRIIHDKAVATLAALARRVDEWRDLIIAGRTHNVAAQPTTVGKRLAMSGEELLDSLKSLEHLVESYPVRGLKGAVGTQMDQLSLFEGDISKVRQLEEGVASHLGLPADWVCVGQVYPRSLDLRTVSALTELASAPSSMCTTLRLMAGHELASEGFAKGQTGSSAMPHKMNARSCERVNGFHVILKGYLAMGAGLSGTQWNEGDVSCSVVRRVMLPDAFFAADGLFETFLTILNQMQVFTGTIGRENDRYMPFLLSTSFLMAAVKAGAGRETAHAAIKEHALAVARELREGAISQNDLLDRLAADERVPVPREQLQEVFEKGQNNTGAATAQVDAFIEAVTSLTERHPEAATYQPGDIL